MSDEQLLAKAYDPADVEQKWYSFWEERGSFHADPASPKEPYVIVIPPPNVTGILTLGHVLNNTLQDILIRFEKMRGRETCWVPGTDHAGIATQTKVEAALKKELGVTRHDLGREKFLEHTWAWKEKYGGTIIRQLRTIGSSCDWERERFTMDPGLSKAVQEVFIRLYNKGLVYKGKRIINWCPKSRTAISDEEVEYKEERGHLWYFRYPYADGNGGVVVATTRPETMLGDTAVAVNPKDERYADKIGRKVILPIVDREIPIIADDFVDPAFGTGAVKVTPAHDPNDYEIGLRHNLPFLNVMHDDGSMNDEAGAEFSGLDRYACRKAVVAKMEELGLVEKIEDYTHQVGYSERGNVPVEPRLSEQWFVSMAPLAEPALAAVNDGRIRFHPERWVKTYRHWMENIKDWCISRQLWWGHRIPAYTCDKCGELTVTLEAPKTCPKCGHASLTQDPDVLDTWFSSWLWPFSVFDWPEETPEMKRFFPTHSLVTGPDIIFFWVARMIMASLEFTGQIPFRDVFFTSIIRDDQGRKMSKSLNNSPDPLEVVKTYGADALRFTMIYIAPVGQDIRYSNEKCEIGRNFANKIWNVVRFRLRLGPASANWQSLDGLTAADLRPDDQWIIARLNATIASLTTALEAFQFNEVSKILYEFIWNEFCDWYLESCKPVFNAEKDSRQDAVLRVFDYCLGAFLRLLHPVMPFVTDELYHQMGFVNDQESIMDAEWPAPMSSTALTSLGADDDIVALTQDKFELIRAVRTLRANYQIPTSRSLAEIIVVPASAAASEYLCRDLDTFKAILGADDLQICDAYQASGPCGVAVGAMATAYVPLAGVVDLKAECERLAKQEDEIVKYLASLQTKLSNEKFVSRAPAEIVAAERAKQAEFEDKLARVREQLAAFSAQA
ncbi:MAG: valine--tRNA ligase [Lentisphaerae bacterium]|jgi:valyl-tRNA synthetase|nr:valine--tRNA ligase [Lentisphaerota bacterium]